MISKFKQLQSLVYKVTRNYDVMQAEQYFINQRLCGCFPYSYFLRDCNNTKNARSKILKPIVGANQGAGTGSGDEVVLTGVPLGTAKEPFKEYDTYSRICERFIKKTHQKLNRIHPDLVFLQVDPSPYIARQRFLAHKCALNQVEDYGVQDIERIDPIKPHAWEECVVNLVMLDMLQQNKVYDQLDWMEGFVTYSYPELQKREIMQANTNKFIQAIDKHILNYQYSPYFLINRILFTALMGKQKVLLGDMPDHLHKMNVGNTLEIQEARDLFKFTLSRVRELNTPISFRKATNDFLPHVFQTPRDLYITAMLKDAFQAAESVAAFVGMHHYNPIGNYWQGPPSGISYTEASRIPPRRRGETDEHQIEKQAMLDVMLESHTWAQPYLSNPFPYLVDDITKVSQEELESMKKCFFMHYKKYNAFKLELQKELPNFKNDIDIRYLENVTTPQLEFKETLQLKNYQDRQKDQMRRFNQQQQQQ